MKMTGDRIRKAIALPLAAGAVPALCAVATAFVSADARAQLSYPIEIVAEAVPDAAASRRFVLISLIPEGTDEALHEQAVAYIRRGLTMADFVPVESVEEADIAVAFRFGSAESGFQPMTSVPRPTWLSTGVGVEIRESDLQNMPTSMSAPPTPVYTNTVSSINVTGVSSARPLFPTGARVAPEQFVLLALGRPVFLELAAFDLPADGDTDGPARLWRTVMYSINSGQDVELMLSAMLAGGQKYFGTHYDEKRYANISDASRAARVIRGETERSGSSDNDPRPGNPAPGR
jgi:hypothetical protein